MSDTIFLGTVVGSGVKLSVPRERLRHVHLRGMTGAGKTSLGIQPLIGQLLQPYDRAGALQHDPIFVFDLGGDPSLFHNTRRLAAKAGRVFKFLTLDPDLESHYFPPFQAVPPGKRNALRIAEMLVTALHMDNGLAYGGSYYSQQNTAALLSVARKLTEQSTGATLEDVATFLDDPQNRKLFRDADQVRMTFDFLREYRQLADAPVTDQEIDFARAIEEAHVVYFFTPTLAEPMTARLVAGLGLFTAIQAAMQRTKRGRPKRAIRICIDEFQEIVGRNLAALLAQARKFGIASLILANQSTSQLETRDSSLVDAIFEGTALKIYYTCVGKRDTEDLQSLSKDKVKVLGGTSTQRFAQTTSTRETIVPALERDTILDVSATFGQAFVVLNDGRGHHEPFIIEQRHALPDLSEVPMPARKHTEEAGPAATLSLVPADDPARKKRHEALARLMQTKRALEVWKAG
jgi:type IV secretory pathway VirB4 component